MKKGPIFIVGAASSGTTMLSMILDNHDEIHLGPEISVFNKNKALKSFQTFRENLKIWLLNGLSTNGHAEFRKFFLNANAYGHDAKSIIRIANETNDFRSFFLEFFSGVMASRGAQVWGDKTGSNIYCAPQILKYFPGAKFIHLVRNPLDAIVSCSKRYVGNKDEALIHGSSHWLYNVSACHAYRDHPSFLTLRYEDLTTDPYSKIKEACDFIEVDFHSEMVTRKNNYWYEFQKGNVHKSWNVDPFNGIQPWNSNKQVSNDLLYLISKLRLTYAARFKLGIHNTSIEKMAKHYGYKLELESINSDNFAYFKNSLASYQMRRLKRELKAERRLFLPLFHLSR